MTQHEFDDVAGDWAVPAGSRPNGYPPELERHHRLTDGRRVFVRPVVPSDAARIERALATADHDTVYQRFFRAPVHLDEAGLARLTHLDYHDRLAIVAFPAPSSHPATDRTGPVDERVEEDGESEGVAIARYEALGGGEAEVAIVVAAGWRRVGIAAALLRDLEAAAVLRGISKLTAVHLPDNRGIAALLAGLGFAPGATDGGLYTASKLLTHAA